MILLDYFRCIWCDKPCELDHDEPYCSWLCRMKHAEAQGKLAPMEKES